MKKAYIIPILDVIKVQMIGAICGVSSGGGTPEVTPVVPGGGGESPNAAPKVV